MLTGDKNFIALSHLGIPIDPLIGFNTLLLPATFAGGPTATHALAAGSPAINAGGRYRPAVGNQRGPNYAVWLNGSENRGC